MVSLLRKPFSRPTHMRLMEQLLLFESVKLPTQTHVDATYFLQFHSDCVLVSEDLHSIHCLNSSCIQTED